MTNAAEEMTPTHSLKINSKAERARERRKIMVFYFVQSTVSLLRAVFLFMLLIY